MFFKKNNKIISGIFTLIFIAIAVTFLASYREPATLSNTEVSNPVIGTDKQPADTAVEKKLILSPAKSSSENQTALVAESKPVQNQNQVIQESAINLIKVTLTAGNNKYDISAPKGATVYGAMAKLASSTSFSFGARYYSGLGYFIDSINGIKNANGNYWTLYVNGTYATVGASAYLLSANDSVEWKYTNKTN